MLMALIPDLQLRRIEGSCQFFLDCYGYNAQALYVFAGMKKAALIGAAFRLFC